MSHIDELWIAGQEFQRPTTDEEAIVASSSRLLDALLADDHDGVQALLVEGWPAGLPEASMLGDLAQVRRLLAAGADPYAPTGRGWTALHLASWSGRAQICAVLVDAGVPVDVAAMTPGACEGCTPLQLAVAQGHGAVAEVLIKAGAEPSRRDDAGWTPLHQAAERGDLPMVKRLLLAGAEVNALCGDTTPLGLAMRGRHIEAAALLKQVGGTD